MSYLQVIIDGPCSGAENMARDAAMLADYEPSSGIVVRLYGWSPPAVSIGYNQREDNFNTATLESLGLSLVRRPTGGRAILHADELTYCVVASTSSDLFGDSLHSSYERINRVLLRFLVGLEIDAEISCGESRSEARGDVCFNSAGLYEVRVGGRKLIGSAQRRTGAAFLQHGSILTGKGHARLVECLGNGIDVADRRDKLLAATTDLGELMDEDIDEEERAELTGRLAAAFAAEFSSADRRG